MNDAYTASGVDIAAGNEAVHRYRELLKHRTDARVLDGIGAFGGCFEFTGYAHPVLVASTDGVGTKVLVAARLDRYDTIGFDLVNHCVNDILCANARPLFFLDYIALAKLDPTVAATVVRGIAAACARNGVALLGGETAEMPGVYVQGTFDIAGTIVGAVERDRMIDLARVAAGDAIVGFPANGFHTNGYSLVRAVIGPERWSDPLPETGQTIGEALLAIHPSYLHYIWAIQEAGIAIKAMAHVTGGGLLDNMPRALPEGLAARFDRSTISVPPIMVQVVREARLDDNAAYRTFNMGVGFCAVVARTDTRQAIDAANAAMQKAPIPGLPSARCAHVGEVIAMRPGDARVIIS